MNTGLAVAIHEVLYVGICVHEIIYATTVTLVRALDRLHTQILVRHRRLTCLCSILPPDFT